MASDNPMISQMQFETRLVALLRRVREELAEAGRAAARCSEVGDVEGLRDAERDLDEMHAALDAMIAEVED